jgi:hypothetical protein
MKVVTIKTIKVSIGSNKIISANVRIPETKIGTAPTSLSQDEKQ